MLDRTDPQSLSIEQEVMVPGWGRRHGHIECLAFDAGEPQCLQDRRHQVIYVHKIAKSFASRAKVAQPPSHQQVCNTFAPLAAAAAIDAARPQDYRLWVLRGEMFSSYLGSGVGPQVAVQGTSLVDLSACSPV